MEYLRGSPARLLKFKEKLAYEFDYCSTPKSKKDRQSRLEGLNLSARKSLSVAPFDPFVFQNVFRVHCK